MLVCVVYPSTSCPIINMSMSKNTMTDFDSSKTESLCHCFNCFFPGIFSTCNTEVFRVTTSCSRILVIRTENILKNLGKWFQFNHVTCLFLLVICQYVFSIPILNNHCPVYSQLMTPHMVRSLWMSNSK